MLKHHKFQKISKIPLNFEISSQFYHYYNLEFELTEVYVDKKSVNENWSISQP